MKTNILTPLVQFFLKNIKTKYIVIIIAISSGIILFANDTLQQKLYLNGFTEKYGEYVGIIFIITLSISLVMILNSFYILAKRKIQYFMNKKYLFKILNDKNSKEYSLIQYIYEYNGSAELKINDYYVSNLYKNNIIYTIDTVVDILSYEVNFMLSDGKLQSGVTAN